MAKIKKRLKLSDRSTETVCCVLRKDGVRVEPSTRKFLSELDEVLSPFYENKRMMMEVRAVAKVTRMVRMRGGKLGKKLVDIKTIVKKEKNVAIVKNTADFLEKIAEMRQIPIQDAWYRVCLDGGGG